MYKMGRIKTQLIKRSATKIVKDNPSKFTTSFDENKQLIKDVAEIRSTKLRNTIVGYITRLVKNER